MRAARKEWRAASGKEASAFTYFTAHSQGKAAVKLRSRPGGKAYSQTPRAGIHRFSLLCGRSYSCQGAGAAVILHFANANYPCSAPPPSNATAAVGGSCWSWPMPRV